MLKLALLGLSLIGVSHGLKAASHQEEVKQTIDCILMDPVQDGIINTDEDIECALKLLSNNGINLTRKQEYAFRSRIRVHPIEFSNLYE